MACACPLQHDEGTARLLIWPLMSVPNSYVLRELSSPQGLASLQERPAINCCHVCNASSIRHTAAYKSGWNGLKPSRRIMAAEDNAVCNCSDVPKLQRWSSCACDGHPNQLRHL